MKLTENLIASLTKNLLFISQVLALTAKVLAGLFLSGIFILITNEYLPEKYALLFNGLIFSLFLLYIASVLRKRSAWVRKKYDTNQLVNKNERLELLAGTIFSDIQRYQSAGYSYFRAVRAFKYSTVILSASSTVILGVNFAELFPWFKTVYPVYSKNAALIIGAVLTAYSSLMAYWNIEKYWLINKTIAHKLQALLYDIENLDRGDIQPGEVDQMVSAYKEIKGNFYKYWEGTLSEKGGEGKS